MEEASSCSSAASAHQIAATESSAISITLRLFVLDLDRKEESVAVDLKDIEATETFSSIVAKYAAKDGYDVQHVIVNGSMRDIHTPLKVAYELGESSGRRGADIEDEVVKVAYVVMEIKSVEILIFVNFGGRHIYININDKATVLELKHKIMDKTGIPTEQQRLIAPPKLADKAKIMEDDKSLNDYNVKNESTIYLVLKLNRN